MYKVIIREIVIIFAFCLCFFAPKFLKIIGFVGSFVFLFLGIVLPPLVHFYHFFEKDKIAVNFGKVIWILVNVGLWIVSTYYSIVFES